MTPAQKQVWDLKQQGKTQRNIAEITGRSRRAVRDLLDRARTNLEASEDRDPGIQHAMDAFGLVSNDVERVWFKNKGLTVQVKNSSAQEEDLLALAVQAFTDLPPAPEIEAPSETLTEMMVVYNIFDLHHGVRTHATISGEELDLESSMQRILQGLARLMAGAPASSRAVICNGGDLTHQTDDTNRTRKSGHVLDVAGRNVIVVDQAIQILSAAIDMALTKHAVVEYFSVPGNHDPQNWETILIGLRERYRLHPQVKIYCNWTDDSHSSEFAVIEHGEVAIFIHHGDKRTPKDLCMFCMAEFREVFGRTKYAVLLTGHLHHLKTDEFPGIIWYQLPAAGPRDAHASGGYKSHSQIKALHFDLHSECGSNSVRFI